MKRAWWGGIILGAVVAVLTGKGLELWTNNPVYAKDDSPENVLGRSHIFRESAKIAAPAVVNITASRDVILQKPGGIVIDWENMRRFYRPPERFRNRQVTGIGSGFVFDAKKGYILTNNHVVSGGDSWTVRLHDGKEYPATLVGKDPQTDVAVLKIEATDLKAANLGDSDLMEVGDWVLACGSPFGYQLQNTVTAGIISAKGRRGLGLTNYENFLQTDAAINHGNSGGPLVNLKGEVIGINTAILSSSQSSGFQGVGFAIPINQARKVAEQLIGEGRVVRGWMGIEGRDLTEAEIESLKVLSGIVINGVFLQGPAHKAGLWPQDILVSINGNPMSMDAIRNAVAEMRPGTVIQLTVLRKEGEAKEFQKKKIDLTLAQQPSDWGVEK
jgi:serine protease Do